MSNPNLRTSPHKIVLVDSDGVRSVVEADEIRFCTPTQKCFTFFATLLACFLGMGIGLVLMLIQGTESVYFHIGTGMLGMCMGVLIPGPNWSSVVTPKQKTGFTPPPSPARVENDDKGLDEVVVL